MQSVFLTGYLIRCVCFFLSKKAGLKVGQALPEKVKIVEVGPRDGLQNEKVTVATLTQLIFFLSFFLLCVYILKGV